MELGSQATDCKRYQHQSYICKIVIDGDCASVLDAECQYVAGRGGKHNHVAAIWFALISSATKY